MGERVKAKRAGFEMSKPGLFNTNSTQELVSHLFDVIADKREMGSPISFRQFLQSMEVLISE